MSLFKTLGKNGKKVIAAAAAMTMVFSCASFTVFGADTPTVAVGVDNDSSVTLDISGVAVGSQVTVVAAPQDSEDPILDANHIDQFAAGDVTSYKFYLGRNALPGVYSAYVGGTGITAPAKKDFLSKFVAPQISQIAYSSNGGYVISFSESDLTQAFLDGFTTYNPADYVDVAGNELVAKFGTAAVLIEDGEYKNVPASVSNGKIIVNTKGSIPAQPFNKDVEIVLYSFGFAETSTNAVLEGETGEVVNPGAPYMVNGLASSSITIKKGSTITLAPDSNLYAVAEYLYGADGAAAVTETYTSSNKNYVAVTAADQGTATLKGVSAGTSTVTVVWKLDGYTFSYKITVKVVN